MFSQNSVIGVIGSGAMGSGITQVAAASGHTVKIYDNNQEALTKASAQLQASLQKLVEKQKITSEQQSAILSRIEFVNDLQKLSKSHLIIEAIVEDLEIKRSVF